MTVDIFTQAIQKVREKAPDFTSRIGIITGSGLSELAETLSNTTHIPFEEIPGVEAGTVAGHHSELILGYLDDTPVACMKGRLHRYEGASYKSMQVLINLLKQLGCDSVIITNASGSLREDIGPGEIMLVNDHINLSFGSPLMGPNEDSIGPRFLSMSNVYDKTMREELTAIAESQGITLHEGVYMGVIGPMFETPAEIRAFRTLGADLVGMSTIPDVIFSRHCDLKVAVLAGITNLAAGITGEELSHDDTLREGKKIAGRLTSIIVEYIRKNY
ncbi:MAG: purine-nucleoside phosphorylase [Gammaproteobacteria bacterium]